MDLHSSTAGLLLSMLVAALHKAGSLFTGAANLMVIVVFLRLVG